MRTLLFLAAGLLLAAAFLLLAKLFAPQYPDAGRVATAAFVVVWLLVAGVNMWLGVSKAGYGVTEELPIFLLIFAVPAAAAILVKWRFL
jgi:hypothetical protein